MPWENCTISSNKRFPVQFWEPCFERGGCMNHLEVSYPSYKNVQTTPGRQFRYACVRIKWQDQDKTWDLRKSTIRVLKWFAEHHHQIGQQTLFDKTSSPDIRISTHIRYANWGKYRNILKISTRMSDMTSHKFWR